MNTLQLPSTFLAGFECSSHRRWDRKRLDLIARTQHDQFCENDYVLAKQHGMLGMRDGFRWHLIETTPGKYDWSSVLPMLRAARRQGVKVIWDLCHYGYPDWLDLWSPEFVERFSAYCSEAVGIIAQESGEAPMICAVNEISFWAWIGGKEGKINPYAVERGPELKHQLVRASIAGVMAARKRAPDTVTISAEPLINIVPDTNDQPDIDAARAYHAAQWEATDMILGRTVADLGGFEEAIDVIGVNFYPHNQWRIRGGFVPLGHHDYKPLSKLLQEVYARYNRPVFIAETGAEYSARTVWLSYIGQEVRTALDAGIPVLGICVYPVTEYHGWDNERICEVGLFGLPDETGHRSSYGPLVREMQRQTALFEHRVAEQQPAV